MAPSPTPTPAALLPSASIACAHPAAPSPTQGSEAGHDDMYTEPQSMPIRVNSGVHRAASSSMQASEVAEGHDDRSMEPQSVVVRAASGTHPIRSTMPLKAKGPGKAPQIAGTEASPYIQVNSKRWYRSGSRQYYWYQSQGEGDMEYPAPIPLGVRVAAGTLFLHINKSTGHTSSWLREEEDGGRWVTVQPGDRYEFDHGTYVYTFHRSTPSWVTVESMRKKRYYKTKTTTPSQT
ncbi:hypothetical protein MD484_g8070, partial [Candolleomyces efflorescens]